MVLFRKSKRNTVKPSPYMTPTQQLAYTRKKRAEQYQEENPPFLTAMRYNGTGFTTTFVNGRDVTRGHIWGENPKDQYRSWNRRAKFNGVKDSLHHSKKALHKVFDRAYDKFDTAAHHKKNPSKQQAAEQQHNPRAVRLREHKSASLGVNHRASMLISKSKFFIGLTRSVSKHLHRTLERVTSPISEPLRNSAYEYPEMNDDEKQIITQWLSDSGDEQAPDIFNVLTTAELVRMKGATIDSIERIKTYHGPPPSPELKATELEEFLDEIKKGEPLDEIEEEAIPRPKCKDLVQYLGTNHSGFHLIKESDSDSTYLNPTNLSDYYDLPLIYPDAQAAEEDEQVIKDDDPEGYDSDVTSSFESSREDQFRLPQSYPPAQSLILYFRSCGLTLDQIAHKVSILDHDFLYSHSSPFIGGYRVPEYWDMDDSVFEKVAELARRPIEEWEVDGARDRFGKVYPETYKVLKGRMRDRGLTRLVRKTVENHLWHRCKRGERPHTDIIR
jgi:hypothetical protein